MPLHCDHVTQSSWVLFAECVFVCRSLSSSRWLTKEELEALLVENISLQDVRFGLFIR